jgi:hypothetical protein
MNFTPLRARRTRFLQIFGSLATATSLAACGGGGNDTSETTATVASCPRSQQSDIWINNRLGCLTVGQRLIDIAAGATGTKGDRAFVIQQLTMDSAFNNVLPGGRARHFRHFICVRNVPANLTPLSLATDLAVAIGTSNSSTTKPPQVSAVSLTVAGGNQAGWQSMPCDPALHPVIVDYDTRLIQSLNPGALGAIQIYDL